MKSEWSARDLAHIAVFAAIIAVMAQISVPMPSGVPMTLQTLAVPLAGLVLGAKRGTLATLLYVLLGTFGVPVFAGLTGGPGIVLGVTGGFIVSFPLMALLAGLGQYVSENIKRSGTGSVKVKSAAAILVSLVIGAAVNYLVGMVWFAAATKGSMAEAFALCVLPFLPTAVIKIIVAWWLGPLLRTTLIKAHVIRDLRRSM